MRFLFYLIAIYEQISWQLLWKVNYLCYVMFCFCLTVNHVAWISTSHQKQGLESGYCFLMIISLMSALNLLNSCALMIPMKGSWYVKSFELYGLRTVVEWQNITHKFKAKMFLTKIMLYNSQYSFQNYVSL